MQHGPDRRDAAPRAESSPTRSTRTRRQLLAAVPHLGGARRRVARPRRCDSRPTDRVGGARRSSRRCRRRQPSRCVLDCDVRIEYPKHGRVPAFRAVDGVNLDDPPGRGGRAGRGVRLRQDHHRPRHRRAAAGRRGHADVVGQDIDGADAKELRAAAPQGRHRLPGPGLVAEPAAPHRRVRSASRCSCTRRPRAPRCSRRVEELLDQVRAAARLPQPLPARALRRPAAARRHRPRARARARAADRRRAHVARSTSRCRPRCWSCSRSCSARLGFACLFISHDLAVVDMLADRIAVMHHGKLVEQGTRDEILRNPQDPYTQRLLAAVPLARPEKQRATPRAARRCCWRRRRLRTPGCSPSIVLRPCPR